jgi:predicted NAD-dependent protein-ADP-ribosyltransferase YbiA (DUF1768 family)
LIDKEEIKMQLGLYEILANTQEQLLDADGDIDLNKFDKPILYTFTLNEIGTVPKKKTSIIGATVANKKRKIWIQQYMNDDEFNIVDPKHDGNCFFSVIQMALEENDQDLSIDEMREILAENATEELFQQYKSLYDAFKTNEATLTREIKNITGRFNTLQTKLKTMKDRNLQLNLTKQSDDMKLLHENLKKERNEVKSLLKEFEFMNGIENLPMLKLKIKTRDYWADTWAISTLERELNIKIIIFSEENFHQEDELNVLQCGQLNDVVLEERGIFEPSFYVLAAYHAGNHYQLITYNNQKSFDFNELPESIKLLVAEKCLEKIAGPYGIIPEFRNYALKTRVDADIEADIIEADESKVLQYDELSSDLYDNATVFRFYSKSADKPLPGKGEGESIGAEGVETYAELARIPQWRKKLSNFWPAEFKLDGHRWLSVEHYYQGSKFKKNNKDFYIKFSLDSKDSPIANDPALAKAAGGRSGKFKGEQIRAKNIMIDDDFFVRKKGEKFTRGEIEMENAMRAKFTQHPELKALLLATKKAKLEHIVRAKPAIVFNDLMRVRRELAQA